MNLLPSLDAHAHIDPCRTRNELDDTGAVLAMTISPDEGEVVNRSEPHIIWGVGCHPRFSKAQDSFIAEKFLSLVKKTALVGEIGLDSGSRVPLETQLKTFRTYL